MGRLSVESARRLAAQRELEDQQIRGDWSGLMTNGGVPVYTLAEIAYAVRKASKPKLPPFYEKEHPGG